MQFLARAALAEDEHRGVQAGDALHGVENIVRGLARTFNEGPVGGILVHLGAQSKHFSIERLPFDGVADERPHLVEIDLFGDEVKGALLDGLHRVIEIAHRRDHDDLGCGVVLAEDRQDFEA